MFTFTTLVTVSFPAKENRKIKAKREQKQKNRVEIHKIS